MTTWQDCALRGESNCVGRRGGDGRREGNPLFRTTVPLPHSVPHISVEYPGTTILDLVQNVAPNN
eukprot:3704185-Rhodomonas_salina.3